MSASDRTMSGIHIDAVYGAAPGLQITFLEPGAEAYAFTFG